MNQSIVWRGFYLKGHEYCRVNFEGERWTLAGAAVFTHENQPSRLEYLVECDSLWRTVASRVSGWVGNELIDMEIGVADGKLCSITEAQRTRRHREAIYYCFGSDSSTFTSFLNSGSEAIGLKSSSLANQ
jgi:Putative glycolipid-binding